MIIFGKINCFCLNTLADSISSENCLLESQKLKKKLVVKHGKNSMEKINVVDLGG